MVRKATLSLACSAIATAVIAAAPSSVLGQAQPGVWEISGAPGLRTPARQCVADIATLLRFEHRSRNCSSKITKQSGSTAQIDYSCGAAGFGHSEVTALTPRSLRIATQGISDGLPFNYVVQARRVGDCPKSAFVTRH